MTNPYAPPQAIVEDIVQAPGEMVLAERLTRLGAAILDNVIVLVAVMRRSCSSSSGLFPGPDVR